MTHNHGTVGQSYSATHLCIYNNQVLNWIQSDAAWYINLRIDKVIYLYMMYNYANYTVTCQTLPGHFWLYIHVGCKVKPSQPRNYSGLYTVEYYTHT